MLLELSFGATWRSKMLLERPRRATCHSRMLLERPCAATRRSNVLLNPPFGATWRSNILLQHPCGGTWRSKMLFDLDSKTLASKMLFTSKPLCCTSKPLTLENAAPEVFKIAVHQSHSHSNMLLQEVLEINAPEIHQHFSSSLIRSPCALTITAQNPCSKPLFETTVRNHCSKSLSWASLHFAHPHSAPPHRAWICTGPR